MKVAIFSDADVTQEHGVTATLRAVLDHRAPDVAPEVYTCSPREAAAPGYRAIPSIRLGLPFSPGLHWPRPARLLQEVGRQAVDLVHVTSPGPAGLAGLSLARHLDVPVVGSLHPDLTASVQTLNGSLGLDRVLRRYARWFYRHCDRILVPSEATARRLRTQAFETARIGVWRHGVNSTVFDSARRSHRLRAWWCVDAQRPAVIYVGRLSDENGAHHLPAIRASLLRHGINHRFVLVGEGPCRATLEAQLPDAIFVGRLAPVDMARVLASADVCLCPGEADAVRNLVLEAQASGLPVLVGDAGGAHEYLVEGETGLVCRSGDAWAFGRALAPLLRDKRRRHAMSVAARAHAVTSQWDTTLASLFDEYRRLVRTRTPTRASRRDPAGWMRRLSRSASRAVRAS